MVLLANIDVFTWIVSKMLIQIVERCYGAMLLSLQCGIFGWKETIDCFQMFLDSQI